ncbi:MAG: hypothetical protein ABH871_00145 [Pseudomonadota bacterium]
MSITAVQASMIQNAATGLQRSLFAMGSGIYPTKVTNPHGILFRDESDLMSESPPVLTFLNIPGLAHEGQRLYSSLTYGPELYPNGREPFAMVQRRLQQATKLASGRAELVLKESHRSVDFIFISNIQRAAERVLSRSDPSIGLLRSAVILLSVPQQNGRFRHLVEQARDQLEEAAELKNVGPDAKALLYGTAWAAHQRILSCIKKKDRRGYREYWGMFDVLGEKVIGAWQSALMPEPIMDDAYRILGGLHACMSRRQYARMIPFLARLSELFPDIASENKLRMAWAMLAQAHEANSETDAKKALASARKQIGDALSTLKHDERYSPYLDDLKEQMKQIGRMVRRINT